MLKSLEDLLKKLARNGVDTFSEGSRTHTAAISLRDMGLVEIRPHVSMPDVLAVYLLNPTHDTRHQFEVTFPRSAS